MARTIPTTNQKVDCNHPLGHVNKHCFSCGKTLKRFTQHKCEREILTCGLCDAPLKRKYVHGWKKLICEKCEEAINVKKGIRSGISSKEDIIEALWKGKRYQGSNRGSSGLHRS